MNFEPYIDLTPTIFYEYLLKEICDEIESIFHTRGIVFPEDLKRLLADAEIIDHASMRNFFRQLTGCLPYKVVLIIDEFDAIPPDAVRGFLHSLRSIYLERLDPRCPYSVGIVGVKNITQLNYDRSISPFNIQDEFHLPHFTLAQIQELFEQYVQEVGQTFDTQVITAIYKQTAGQPFLVNRCAQILTEEMDIPKSEAITMSHFSKAHRQLLRERNTNIEHLLTNIRRDPRFESLLMRIISYERGVRFNIDNEIIDELLTYGIITERVGGMCGIANPIYQHHIQQNIKPLPSKPQAQTPDTHLH